MRRLVLMGAVGGLLLIALGGGSFAFAKQSQDRERTGQVRINLIGFNEVPSISTQASGLFVAQTDDDEIRYRLSYEGLEGATTLFAHIHLGQRHTNGGVSAFLCGGGDKPGCPARAGTVQGTIDAADVLTTNAPGGAFQGIAATEIGELVRAIDAGAAYVNVHSNTFPGGEIRGQFGSGLFGILGDG